MIPIRKPIICAFSIVVVFVEKNIQKNVFISNIMGFGLYDLKTSEDS
jgi:hypothetical protein